MIRRERLEREICALVPDSRWAQDVARLRCLRGIDTLSAIGLCVEIGDFARFPRPGKLMSFLGVVPSENSSGDKRRQGAITKAGSGHARRLLVEAAWHYRRPPRRGTVLQRRQAGQPEHICQISWTAQQRLHRTWRRLDHQRGKPRTIAAVAVARELAGFCWAITTADRSGQDSTSVDEAAGTTRATITRESTRELTLSTSPAGHARPETAGSHDETRSCGHPDPRISV